MCLVRLAQIVQHVNRKERKWEKYKMIQVLSTIPIIFSKVPKEKKNIQGLLQTCGVCNSNYHVPSRCSSVYLWCTSNNSTFLNSSELVYSLDLISLSVYLWEVQRIQNLGYPQPRCRSLPRTRSGLLWIFEFLKHRNPSPLALQLTELLVSYWIFPQSHVLHLVTRY